MSNFTIAQALVEAAQILRKGGVPEARREAADLVSYVTGRDRTFLLTNADSELGPSEIRRLREYVERRAAGEPLQYITGHQAFYALDFEVAPGVLIPRPETETLVEKALALLENKAQTICDVGTGSGCIAISILHERPQARGLGLDISSRALEIAGRNAHRHGVADRFETRESDCFSGIESGRRFSMIVSNPPYVTESALPTLQREVRDHEPIEALTSGPDGLNVIRRLIAEGPAFLEPGGYMLFEMGFDQNEAVRALVESSPWHLEGILDDLQGIPRIVVLRNRAEAG
jgi:release factor glutamine methyltransferase